MSEDNELLLKILQALNRIENKLDSLQEITTLIKLDKQDSIVEIKSKYLDRAPLRKSIYNLCDGKHTVSEISKELNKSISLISQNISHLQEYGFIKEERKGKQKYYQKVI